MRCQGAVGCEKGVAFSSQLAESPVKGSQVYGDVKDSSLVQRWRASMNLSGWQAPVKSRTVDAWYLFLGVRMKSPAPRPPRKPC